MIYSAEYGNTVSRFSGGVVKPFCFVTGPNPKIAAVGGNPIYLVKSRPPTFHEYKIDSKTPIVHTFNLPDEWSINDDIDSFFPIGSSFRHLAMILQKENRFFASIVDSSTGNVSFAAPLKHYELWELEELKVKMKRDSTVMMVKDSEEVRGWKIPSDFSPSASITITDGESFELLSEDFEQKLWSTVSFSNGKRRMVSRADARLNAKDAKYVPGVRQIGDFSVWSSTSDLPRTGKYMAIDAGSLLNSLGEEIFVDTIDTKLIKKLNKYSNRGYTLIILDIETYENQGWMNAGAWGRYLIKHNFKDAMVVTRTADGFENPHPDDHWLDNTEKMWNIVGDIIRQRKDPVKRAVFATTDPDPDSPSTETAEFVGMRVVGIGKL